MSEWFSAEEQERIRQTALRQQQAEKEIQKMEAVVVRLKVAA